MYIFTEGKVAQKLPEFYIFHAKLQILYEFQPPETEFPLFADFLLVEYFSGVCCWFSVILLKFSVDLMWFDAHLRMFGSYDVDSLIACMID